jgi:hypothetical protein
MIDFDMFAMEAKNVLTNVLYVNDVYVMEIGFDAYEWVHFDRCHHF